MNADNCTAGEITAALKTGCFYGSTGVTITNAAAIGTTVHVETDDAQRIRFISNAGVIQSTVDATQASYTLPENPDAAAKLGYIRAECYGAGGRMAWTQPFFIRTS